MTEPLASCEYCDRPPRWSVWADLVESRVCGRHLHQALQVLNMKPGERVYTLRGRTGNSCLRSLIELGRKELR